jgi:hypothetical protein
LRKKNIFLLLGILATTVSLTAFSSFYSAGIGQAVSAAETVSGSYDLVIKYAQIMDGTGEKAVYRGDIAIKDGKIVKVGYVAENELAGPKRVSVFDAGGLTVMPFPVSINRGDQLVEHLFATSYPRYPAHYLYFQDGDYAGLNLLQVARQKGEKPEQTFKALCVQLPENTKVYLLPVASDEQKGGKDSYSVEELVAVYTGELAAALGRKDAGTIEAGRNADLYFFITHHYDEQSLRELLYNGEFPALALSCKQGELTRE